MTQASVGFHCPECAKSGKQKVYTSSSLISRPVVTIAIIAVNLAIFVLDLRTGGTSLGRFGDDGALIGHGVFSEDGQLVEVGVAVGEWWRIFTSGFLHVSLIHVGMNMFLLWQLGQMLEPPLGRVGFVVLYVMSLLGGSFLVLTISPDQPTIGASGAVFGLMGAAFIGLRARGIDPFSTGIGGLIVLNLIITLVFSRYISVGGHVGGLLAGALGGYLLLDVAPRIRGNGTALMVAACVGASGLLFAASVWIADNPVV